jgi:hypothetical protein
MFSDDPEQKGRLCGVIFAKEPANKIRAHCRLYRPSDPAKVDLIVAMISHVLGFGYTTVDATAPVSGWCKNHPMS